MNQSPPPIPVCESADENSFHVEDLRPETNFQFGWLIGISAIVFLGIFIWQVGSKGGAISDKIIGEQLAFFVIVSLCAFYPIWMGLGTEPTAIRFGIGIVFCIPAIFLFGWEIFVRGIFWLIAASSFFWIMRVFRWRLTRAAKLFIMIGKSENFDLITANSSFEQNLAARNWYRFRQSENSSFRDAFLLQQYETKQLMMVFVSIGAFLAIAKLVHNQITLIDTTPQMLPYLIALFLGYPTVALLAIWVALGKKNVALRFAASIGLIFVVTFAIVFWTTTSTIINLQADWYQTIFPFSYASLGFSMACFLFCLPRLAGYRLLRLPPTGYEKETT